MSTVGSRHWTRTSGKLIWRGYSTGPDSQVLIGADFKPHYAAEQGKDLGVSSWPPEAWRIGGGGAWGWVTFDAELNTLYEGVGNPGPWNQQQRPGDNKWTAGMFARDPATGSAHWFYQYSPHDEHDYDGVNEQILLDMPFAGKMQKVLVHIDRNGYVYVIERQTGTVLSADPYGPVNTSQGIDLQSGRPILNPEKETKLGETVREHLSDGLGRQGLESEQLQSADRASLHSAREHVHGLDERRGELHRRHALRRRAGAHEARARRQSRRTDGLGSGQAQSPCGRTRRIFPSGRARWSTAGDVVFYGTMDGWFKAVNARTGELLWRYKVDSGIISQPVSYKGPDGHQYIAVLSGVGGWSGAVVSGPVDPRDGSAALGMVNVMSDLPKYTTAGGTLYVFSLPH